jgi:hypothetical protein
LPVRGQRTRSNAITARSHVFNDRIRNILRYVKFEELRLRLTGSNFQQVKRHKSVSVIDKKKTSKGSKDLKKKMSSGKKSKK